ncbi:MAG: hypothetical protein J6B80_00915 [Clostridia bacterium]|nr:hypothetical protein [Clostridia bacterium]
MKDILLKSLKVYGHLIIVAILCFFLVVSFNALKIGLFTKDIGYDMYLRTSEDAEPEFLYTYFYEDGEDLKLKEYEDQKDNLVKYSIRSDVEKTPDIALSVISQIFCIMMLVSFLYNDLWKVGNKDFEAMRIHSKKFSRLKGLYIGLIAILPSFIFLTFALVTKNSVMANSPIALFTYSNSYAFEIIIAVTKGAMHWADVKLWQAMVYYAVLFITPIVCEIAYVIGFKDISIGEKLIYKNSKKRG